MKDFGNNFRDTFGYDPARARIEFGWALRSAALTINDTIIIDPGKGWTDWDNVAQGELLVHELTHCVQYEQAGALAVMSRRLAEDLRYGDDAYNRAPALKGITDLRTLNVMDRRFTIESIATHVEKSMTANYAAAAMRRR